MKRISFLLVFLAALGLAFGACSKGDDKKKDDDKAAKPADDEGDEDTADEGTDEATDDEATDETADDEADEGEEAAAGEFGVPECDEYMEKMMACLDKLPEQAQTAAKTAWEQSQEAWKEAASTDEGKKALAQTCKTAMEAAASSYKAMGCEF